MQHNITFDINYYLEHSLNDPSNRSLSEAVLMSVGMAFYTIFGVLGNGLVLLALYSQRKWAGLDSVMLIFISNLTICDFLICLMTFPATSVSAAVDRWILGSITCWVVSIFVTYLRITAILFMTVICIHRAVVIKYPFDNFISESRGRKASIFIWIVSMIPQIGPFFGYNPFHYDAIRAVCIANVHPSDHGSYENGFPKSLSMIYALLYVAVPMLLISVIYSKILYIAITSKRKSSHMRRSQSSEKRGSKAIVTTLVLVGSFIVCFLPFLVITAVNQLTKGVMDEMIVWGEFSSSFHCIINPLIYFYTNRTFRTFMLRPFRNTFLSKTKLYAKYNTNAFASQNIIYTKSSSCITTSRLNINSPAFVGKNGFMASPPTDTTLMSHYPKRHPRLGHLRGHKNEMESYNLNLTRQI